MSTYLEGAAALGVKPAACLGHLGAYRQSAPPRLVVYGVEGIGKSSFAAGAPNTILLGPEDGTETLDVKRYPKTRSWSEVLDAVDDLTLSDHGYQTLAIDTLDWIEPLIHDAVCKSVTPPKTSIEEFASARATSRRSTSVECCSRGSIGCVKRSG